MSITYVSSKRIYDDDDDDDDDGGLWFVVCGFIKTIKINNNNG